MNRFLDIALVCEINGDMRMARLSIDKAIEIKKNCQGVDFPNFGNYIVVQERIRKKTDLADLVEEARKVKNGGL